MKCTLCQTGLTQNIDEFYFICNTCGALVKDKQFYPTPENEKNRYEEHNNDVNDINYQNFVSPITNAVLNYFRPTDFGLDYGCGTGPVISKMLIDKGYNVKLYDPFFRPDGEYRRHLYDYIYCCEVFEHFHNPKQEIEKLIELLKPGGLLLIMTSLYQDEIDFGTWRYRNDQTHVFIYTAKTFRYIADHFDLSVQQMDDEIIILKKS
ncbi:MAG: class I SAM-dependent methyltransferase [Candidatus Kapaibacterium sp.]